MIPVLENQRTFQTAEEFVQELNKARLQNKKKWITYSGTVQGCDVAIKTYDTGYLQILNIDNVRCGGGMDMKVGAWKTCIQEAIERAAERREVA
jgi:hypothetical protein